MSPYIRTVTTASGATVVQIIYSRAGGRRTLDHIGSAHSNEELAILIPDLGHFDVAQIILTFGPGYLGGVRGGLSD